MENAPEYLEILQWSEDECREYLEAQRWPNGPRCPKCGAENPYTINRKSRTKNRVTRLYRCRAKDCRKQFTPTVGTIFEDSKIPLRKWFAAIALMCASKKGVSAHQLYRMLSLGSYRTAWFMCHRVREAMRDKTFEKLSGTVEADATYVGGKTRRGHPVKHERIQDEIEMGLRPRHPGLKRGQRHPRLDKAVVLGVIERKGRARTQVVKSESGPEVRPILSANVDLANSRLITDGSSAYRRINEFGRHDVIDHELAYVQGDVHTQVIESHWALLKRAYFGTFHHISADYLPQYLPEFEFRWDRRNISDGERFADLLAQVQGRLTRYCQTPQPENPHA